MDIKNLSAAVEINRKKEFAEKLLCKLDANTDKVAFDTLFDMFSQVEPDKADAMFAIMRTSMIDATKAKIQELIKTVESL